MHGDGGQRTTADEDVGGNDLDPRGEREAFERDAVVEHRFAQSGDLARGFKGARGQGLALIEQVVAHVGDTADDGNVL